MKKKFDIDLYNHLKEYVDREYGNDKIAYRIEDDGSKTLIQLGHYEMVMNFNTIEIFYVMVDQDPHSSTIYEKDDFNLEYMLDLVKRRRREYSQHMLTDGILEYQAIVRESIINRLL